MTSTRNGDLTVILMIGQNQNQMMMETCLVHLMMTCDSEPESDDDGNMFDAFDDDL